MTESYQFLSETQAVHSVLHPDIPTLSWNCLIFTKDTILNISPTSCSPAGSGMVWMESWCMFHPGQLFEILFLMRVSCWLTSEIWKYSIELSKVWFDWTLLIYVSRQWQFILHQCVNLTNFVIHIRWHLTCQLLNYQLFLAYNLSFLCLKHI